MGKTSGFERLYARVTKLYFGGMARHLAELRPVLRPGAQIACVVGEQASSLRVMIRAGDLLADTATSLGYEVIGIEPVPHTAGYRHTRAVTRRSRAAALARQTPHQKQHEMKRKSRYAAIIERIFSSKFKTGMRQVDFERAEIETVARQLRIKLPKNLGDLIYNFRYRAALPERICTTASQGEIWIVRPNGKTRHCLILVPDGPLHPNPNLAVTKIPDATPGIVTKYAFNDEQAPLARPRYNRLVDIFTGEAKAMRGEITSPLDDL